MRKREKKEKIKTRKINNLDYLENKLKPLFRSGSELSEQQMQACFECNKIKFSTLDSILEAKLWIIQTWLHFSRKDSCFDFDLQTSHEPKPRQ